MKSNIQSRPKPPTVFATANSVKARIIGAGLNMRTLAERARLSPGALTNYIAGRRRRRSGQFEIYMAFVSLAPADQARVTFEEFWGKLLNRVVA